MRRIKQIIPNPNRISNEEKNFIGDTILYIENSLTKIKKEQYKGRMISMSDTFYQELNNYIKENPTEGNRSSFIVRVVAEYISNKKLNI